MTTADTLQIVNAYWSDFLGCSVEGAFGPGAQVVLHRAGRRDHGDLHVFCRGNRVIVSGPENLPAPVLRELAASHPEAMGTAEFWRELLGEHATAVLGPAWLCYADQVDFREVDARGTRRLASTDQVALETLAQACGSRDWSESALDASTGTRYGCFEGSVLVAAGVTAPGGHSLRQLGIVTHPAYRNQGWGRAVVSHLAAHALSEGAVPQYRVQIKNLPSLALAISLGFCQYAQTLAIHLRLGGTMTTRTTQAILS